MNLVFLDIHIAETVRSGSILWKLKATDVSLTTRRAFHRDGV
jgi:hypothetical protein